MGVAAAVVLAVGPAARGEVASGEGPEAPSAPSAEAADQEDSGDVADEADAEALAWEAFALGERHFAAEEYAEAAAAFERAFDLQPRPTVHFNIARSLELAGRRELARARYQAFIDSGAGSPERRHLARERIASLAGSTALLVVGTYPPGGVVVVDGREEGEEPRTVAVRPGRHLVEVRLRGVTSRRSVEVGHGERRSLAFALDPAAIAGTDPGAASRERRRVHPGYFGAMLGLSVAATIATVSLYAAALSAHLDSHETDDFGSIASSDAQMLAAAGDVSLGFALGLPAVAVVLAFFTDWSRTASPRPPSDRASAWDLARPLALSF